tara:strand:+ start:15485 stop:15667 length:183 start_codon:yes stop_codon:yes gene_type:complete
MVSLPTVAIVMNLNGCALSDIPFLISLFNSSKNESIIPIIYIKVKIIGFKSRVKDRQVVI